MRGEEGNLFTSTELAARIERAEADLLRACAETVRARRPELDVLVRDLAGGVAAFTAPGSPINKVAGVGFAGALDPDALAALERESDARGVPLQFELSSLAEPGHAALLCERGYRLVGFESVLGLALPLAEPSAPAPGVTVEPDLSSGADAWVDLVATGFDTPDGQGVASHESFTRDALVAVMSDFVRTPGMVRVLARLDGAPAGGGTMRMHEGIAQLCGAATLPEHRLRGVQTAVLGARLAQAGAAGCDLATITTQPGSKSAENVQRRGFALLYVRAVLVREPAS